ncbi:phosphoglycerate kinase [Patescibacteria group bacterium]|nr:phosphoglycerate kinase [Patescibacteria group bacterium]
MSYSSINRLRNLKGKNSLVFCDFGVNFRSDTKFTKVDNDTKYRKHLETIEKLSFLGSKVIIAPSSDKEIGLISRNFEKLLKLNPKFNSQVIFYDNSDIRKIFEVIDIMKDGDILILKNLNSYINRTLNKNDLSKFLKSFISISVFDDFSSFYSDNKIYLSLLKNTKNYIGYSFEEDFNNLNKIYKTGNKNKIALVSGLYEENRILFIENLLKKDYIILLGGEIALAFIKVSGFRVGITEFSRVDREKINYLIKKYDKKIVFPVDLIVSDNKTKEKNVVRKKIEDIGKTGYVCDIGPETIKVYTSFFRCGEIILWSGLLGFTENARFTNGSKMIMDVFVNRSKTSVFGASIGNRTCDFILKNGFSDDIDYLFYDRKVVFNYFSSSKSEISKLL